MRVLSSQALAALDTGRFAIRTLLGMDLGSGFVGFWDDAYDITLGGKTYLATYGGFRVTPIPSSSDLGVRSADVVFSGLDPRAASEVEAEEWHQRPVTISLAILSVDDPQVLNVAAWFTGFADHMTRREAPGGQTELIVRCEGIGRELSRRGARTRADSDQRQIDANDGFFKHTVTASNTPVQWGRGAPQAPPPRSKPGGLIGFLEKIF